MSKLVHTYILDTTIEDISANLRAINGTSCNYTPNEIALDAIAVYRWHTEQLRLGRAVVSTGKDLTNLTQVGSQFLPARDPTV